MCFTKEKNTTRKKKRKETESSAFSWRARTRAARGLAAVASALRLMNA